MEKSKHSINIVKQKEENREAMKAFNTLYCFNQVNNVTEYERCTKYTNKHCACGKLFYKHQIYFYVTHNKKNKPFILNSNTMYKKYEYRDCETMIENAFYSTDSIIDARKVLHQLIEGKYNEKKQSIPFY
jgi:hypothetical protein